MKLKKIVSLILAMSMMLSVLSSSAFAQSNDNTQIIDLTSEPADEMKPTPTPTGSEPEPTSETQPTPTPEPINTAQPTPSPEPTEPGSGTQPSPTPTAPADTEEDAPKPASLPQSIGDDEGIMPVYNGDVQDGVFTVAVDGIDMTFEILTEPSEGVNGTVQFGDNSWANPAIPADTVGTVNIPQTIELNLNTYDVVDISYSAFMNCNEVNVVTVPMTVTVPDGYKLASVFQLCLNIESINVDNDNPNFSSEDGVLYNKLKTSLLEVPNAKTGNYTMLDSVNEMYISAFNDSRVTNINVSDSNMAYASEDGVLYNKDKTFLYRVPETKEGHYEVLSGTTVVYDSAFMNCDKLTSITLPDSLETINFNAFNNCSKLTSITIPVNVIEFNSNAFDGCSSLEEINVSIDNQYYSSVNGALLSKDGTMLVRVPQAFQGDYTVPENVTTIGERAFQQCEKIESIILSDGVTTFDGYNDNFAGATGLKSLKIGAGLQEINIPELLAYDVGENLENVEVSFDNVNYSSENGVLFNKDKSELLLYPGNKAGEEYTIPESVTKIGSKAFLSANINSVLELPVNITNISEDAFEGADSIRYFISKCDYNQEGMSGFANYNWLPIYYSLETTGWENVPNAQPIPENKFEYEIIEGAVKITGFSGIGDVIIPNTIENLPVTTIGERAFSDKSTITSLVIGDNVTAIEYAAFEFTSSLTSIVFGKSVETLSSNALNLMHGLVSIEVPEENQFFSSENGVLYNKDKSELIMYPKARTQEEFVVLDSVTKLVEFGSIGANIGTVVIGDNVSEIEPLAFNFSHIGEIVVTAGNQNYSSLNGVLTSKDKSELIFYTGSYSTTEYTVPDGIRVINSEAFSSADSLSSIVIGKDVRVIGDEHNPNLHILVNVKNLSVAQGNEYFSGIDGVLFNKSIDELILFPSGSERQEYVVPESVEKIAFSAIFSHHLKKIVLSDAIETLASNSFGYLSALESITFGENLNEIEDVYSLSGLPSLTSVHFKGGYSSNFEDFFNKYPTVTVTYDDNAVGWENKGESWPKTEGDFEYEVFGGDIAIARYSGAEAVVNVPDTILGLNVASILSFGSSHTLSEVNIGSGIDYIDESAFDYSWNLQNINVATENLAFSSNNGALLNKDGTQLIKVPNMKSGIYTVPNGVEIISNGAFGGNVDYVTITKNVTQIEEGAFAYYHFLHTVLFDVNYSEGLQGLIDELEVLAPNCNIFYTSDATGWENVDNVQLLPDNPFLYEVEEDGVRITKYIGSDSAVVIPDTIDGKLVTDIDQEIFSGYGWITSIDFGDNIEIVPSGTMSGLYSIESVRIGDSIVSIDFGEFSYNEQFKEFDVSKNNSVYSSQNGVLFNKNATELLKVPEGKSGTYAIPKSVEIIAENSVSNTDLTHLEIPDSVTEIAYRAIASNIELSLVDIGDGLVSISESAFIGSSIVEIQIPNKLETLGANSFAYCEMLERVYFDGNYNSNMQPGIDSIRLEAQVYYNPSATGWEAVSGAIPLEEYQYEETGETVKIVKYLGFDREVVVPSEINGKAVTAVEDGAFSNCINIDSLILPNSITQISGNFFGESTYGGELFIPLSNTYLKTYFDSISVPYTYLTEVVPETEGTATEELKPEIPQEDISNIFTNEEIEASEETSIAVKLTVDKMEESAVPAEETVAIEAKIQEYQETLIEETVVVAEIIDITLTKTVGSTETDITELNKPIRITIDIPEEHKASNRTYVIVRVHEGVAEILEDLDDNPDTITFETGKFSTYGIAYSEGDYIPGDVDGDGSVTILDAITLRRYVAKWDVIINEDASDVDADGDITILDAITLRRYVAKWDVILK